MAKAPLMKKSQHARSVVNLLNDGENNLFRNEGISDKIKTENLKLSLESKEIIN